MPDDGPKSDLWLSNPRYVLVAAVASVVALGLAVVHIVYPTVEVDNAVLALLALAIVPWILPLLKTVEVAGVKMELRDLQQAVQKGLEENRTQIGELAKHLEKLRFAGTTPEEEKLMRRELEPFHAYLTSLGLPTPGDLPSVTLTPGLDNAQYVPESNAIEIDNRLARDRDVLYREYAHAVLISGLKGYRYGRVPLCDVVESALADYFGCSYKGEAVFGRKVAQVWHIDQGYIRSLDNSYTFRRYHGMAPQVKGEVWGGLFWSIRSVLGQRETDEALADAWMRSDAASDEKTFIVNFVGSVMRHARDDRREAVRRAISRRGALRITSDERVDLVRELDV